MWISVCPILDFILFAAPVTFLLAQKRGDKPAFVEPARALAKKGYPDPVSLRDGTQCFCPHSQPAPRWAKNPTRFFYWLVLRTAP